MTKASECEWCGARLSAAGRSDRRTCSTRCRVALHRTGLPRELTGRRAWARAAGKRPVRVNGAPASSTDPATWASFSRVWRSGAGDGAGVMLGGGLGCYDLDHVSDAEARELLAEIPEPILWIERSLSGEGVHAFVEAPEGPGTRRGNVERYTRGRFIRVTGRRFE